MKKSIFIFTFLAAFAPFFVFAQGLVPCGVSGKPPCTISCFFVMISNIINFILIKISLPLAATAFMVSGIILIVGGSEKAITRGKDILKFTFIGMLLAFGAWLMIDLILRGLLRTSYLPWNKFPTDVCVAERYENIIDNPYANIPNMTPEDKNEDIIIDNPYDSYVDGIDTGSDREWYDTYFNPPGEAEGSALDQMVPDFTEYDKKINDYVGSADLNGVDPNRIKAIIQAESSGKVNAVGNEADGKKSYGLMQVRADTARFYDKSLAGLTEQEIGDKLINDPQYNKSIGTKYYSDLLNKYGDPALASAAYNGGPAANKPSKNCPGLLRWQCGWDNDEHTVPNTGYAPTRKYIDNINRIYNQLTK